MSGLKCLSKLSAFNLKPLWATRLQPLLLLPVFLVISPQAAYAACKGIDCACKPSELQFASPVLEPGENGKYPISLEADNVEAQGEDLVTLSGNAEVSQGRQTIVADELKYYRSSDRVVAIGNVEMISADGDYMTSDSIDVHAPTQIGQLKNGSFKLAKSLRSKKGIDTVRIESRGTADLVNLEGEGLVRLSNASYTTCNEGNDSVMVSAKELELDQNAGVGKARNATIRFKGVPVFYLPYASFPISDERKTGFLTPGIGTNEESGFNFDIPWYWNIAPNQDATITPRYFVDRGLQVAAEYRHQSKLSSTALYGEFLPDDDSFGEDRDLLSLQHTQSFTRNLVGRLNYNDVSDSEYFDDFRGDIRSFSASFVPRDVSLSYSGKYLKARARANEYQIIDPDIAESRKPYERLPSLTFSTRLPDGPYGLKYGLHGSYTNFSSDFRVEGKRTALTPYASLPLKNIWGYVTPTISFNHRTYSLDNTAPGTEDSPSFTVPIFSLDAGIYFEKNSSWFGESVLHTLEPRIFYAYAPDEDQSDAPVFDTSQVFGNNFGNIFRANRFYGEDRVGDTNQVTFGVTTRLIDNETGDQRLKASIGQLVRLEDQTENLNPDRVIESGVGDLLAEMRTESKAGWTTYSFLQYDHDESEIRTARFALGYEPDADNRKRLSVGYYFSNGRNRDVDQLTLSASWPLSDRWQINADERYSLEDSENILTSVGLEYNACCWKIRFTGQERLHNRNIKDKTTNFFVELELTTLGRFRSSL